MKSFLKFTLASRQENTTCLRTLVCGDPGSSPWKLCANIVRPVQLQGLLVGIIEAHIEDRLPPTSILGLFRISGSLNACFLGSLDVRLPIWLILRGSFFYSY